MMISKKEFAEFCFSLNEEQRKSFLEILDLQEKVDFNKEDFGVGLFLEQLTLDGIENQPTNEIYIQYKIFCKQNKITSTNKIQFSKVVKRVYPVDVMDKKIDGVKYRLFVFKDGDGE